MPSPWHALLSRLVLSCLVLSCLVLCLFTPLALADGIGIPITGTASQGFALTLGDFSIQGPGLSLFQGLPDGQSEIGTCNGGTVCNFSFTIDVSGASFCTYCVFYDSGSVGNKVAELLVPSLHFTGSAVYSGGTSITVPMTVSGTIIGYQLINCDSNGLQCSLGPEVFAIKIVGNATGVFTMVDLGGGSGVMQGVRADFTGTATEIPEPISLVLTGTGLAGLFFRTKTGKKFRRGSHRTS